MTKKYFISEEQCREIIKTHPWNSRESDLGWDRKNNKKIICDEMKKCGIKCTGRIENAGYLFAVAFTVTVPENMTETVEGYTRQFIAEHYPYINFFDVPDDMANDIRFLCGSYNGSQISRSDFYNRLDGERQEKIAAYTAERQYNHNPIVRVKKCFREAVETVVGSYNHDNSDGMTDYFDRGIYDRYTWKFAGEKKK